MKRKLVYVMAVIFCLISTTVYAQEVDMQALRNQISALLERVRELQAQLSEMTGRPVTPMIGDAATLYRPLKMGDRGEDVRALQRILNRRAETRIADAGPGSPGNETDYFGALTRDAVIRYQELHRDTVLSPLRLLRGTGYVGASTLAQLRREDTLIGTRAVSAESSAQSSVNNNTSESAVTTADESVSVSGNMGNYIFMFPSEGDTDVVSESTSTSDSSNGKEDTQYGSADDLVVGVYTATTSQVRFSINVNDPATRSAVANVFAEGAVLGEARITEEGVVFLLPPLITGVSAGSVSRGDTVTLYGGGFVPDETGTILLVGETGTTTVHAFSPDGTTLPFVIPSDMATGTYVIRVRNSFGISIDPTKIDIIE